ncbi:MAG: endonuclease domain-containing protein [Paludibacteraceae bacterium]|nr:endonuclease domain-containing protein [Paludibacteraceae bacterium]MCK9615554.1 endonuclease domain-containing protein [Candidatus Omnitrophota bacterium]
MQTQICKECGKEKPLSEFWETISGYEKMCKACRMLRRYEQRLKKRKENGQRTRTLTTREVNKLRENGLRYCPRCKRVLPLEEFSHTKGKKNNSPHCHECCSDLLLELREKEEYKNSHKEYYKQRKEQAKNRNLLIKYGISLEMYNEMLEKQDGKCAVCGKTTTENGKCLAVDHDHKTGKIRGLLCNNCNVSVGFLQDNPELALVIHEYLKNGG